MTRHSMPKSILMFTLLVSVSFCSPLVHAADRNVPLPLEARQAFDKGMAAVEQKEWPTAIRYFLKAQEVEPYAPEVLFNLGLAESKVPGRELRAMAWFQAYLLAAPTAANAEAVRREITALKVRVQGTLDRLVAGAIQMAGGMPVDDDRQYAFSVVAHAQARTGDFDGALQSARKSIESYPNWGDQNYNVMKIAVMQYNAGDHVGAMDTVRALEKGNWVRSSVPLDYSASLAAAAYRNIAYLQAAAGDFSKAEETCRRPAMFIEQMRALDVLAWAEAIAGKKAEALAHAERATKIGIEGARAPWPYSSIEKPKPSDIQFIIHDIAVLQAILGDTAGAKKTDALFGADARQRSEIEDLGNSRDPTDKLLQRDAFAVRSWGESLESVTGEVGFFYRSKPTISDVINFISSQLSSELFTNPANVLRAIDAKPMPIVEAASVQRRMIDEFAKKIVEIADKLHRLRKLSQ